MLVFVFSFSLFNLLSTCIPFSIKSLIWSSVTPSITLSIFLSDGLTLTPPEPLVDQQATEIKELRYQLAALAPVDAVLIDKCKPDRKNVRILINKDSVEKPVSENSLPDSDMQKNLISE